MLVLKRCSCSFKSITVIDNKFRSFLLNSNIREKYLRKLELDEVNLAPKLMIFSVCTVTLFSRENIFGYCNRLFSIYKNSAWQLGLEDTDKGN